MVLPIGAEERDRAAISGQNRQQLVRADYTVRLPRHALLASEQVCAWSSRMVQELDRGYNRPLPRTHAVVRPLAAREVALGNAGRPSG